MRKSLVILCLLGGVILWINLAAQVQSSSSSSIDQSKFAGSFKKVVESSINYFTNIFTDNLIETRNGKENEVTVNFPAASIVGYSEEEWEDPYLGLYYELCITAYYFNGNNKTEALKIFEEVKKALIYCKNNEILGTWTYEEDSNSTDKIDIKMRNSKYSDLLVKLSYWANTWDEKQYVELSFELPDWGE